MLEENDSSKNFFVLNASYLEELATSTIFDGYRGIQSTNLMVVCYPNHSKKLLPYKHLQETAKCPHILRLRAPPRD